jgi:uncharacterized membrane protein YvlD (DUF360 family)
VRPTAAQPPAARVVFHLVALFVADTIALLLLSELLTGFVLDSFGAALLTALLAGIFNNVVWPPIARFTIRLSVLTLGFFSLIANAALLLLAVGIVPGAHLNSLFAGIVVIVCVTVLTTLVSSVLMFDEDEIWYRSVVRPRRRRKRPELETDVPGVIFLEIDGLAHDVLRSALSSGNAPTLARWIDDGTHRLERWETDWSSQTGACQAGLLHGNNDDMPAFRWWEKDRDAAIVTNHPRDAAEIERRHSDGRGLLYADGASRANILSGDAPHSMLTMSTVLARRGKLGRDYATYFGQPYAIVHTSISIVAEIFRERRAALRQRRLDVRPRIKRHFSYALVRAFATVIQLDLQVAAVVGDMLEGRPVVYTTFLAYDEVAHHSGIQRPDTLEVLRRVDRSIARVERAVADAPRPYRLIVLSDHGQSQGATFLQRYDQTLEQLVDSVTEGGVADLGSGQDDALAYVSAGLTEVASKDTVAGHTVRIATRRQTTDGAVSLGEDTRHDIEATHDGAELPELSVMASGCLGLISFPREPGRVTLERLKELHPKLLDTLREHPGIGFVMVRSQDCGAVVLGATGTHYLDEDRVEGDDPLAPFGPHAADHVRRTDRFAHCPDVLVNSTYWDAADEVAAFEELVGSHGGMGGTQSFPFVLRNADLDWPDGDVVGAESVHRVLRRWLSGLGQAAYDEDSSSSDAPGSSTATVTDGVA